MRGGGLKPGEARLDASQEGGHVVERMHAGKTRGRAGEVATLVGAKNGDRVRQDGCDVLHGVVAKHFLQSFRRPSCVRKARSFIDFERRTCFSGRELEPFLGREIVIPLLVVSFNPGWPSTVCPVQTNPSLGLFSTTPLLACQPRSIALDTSDGIPQTAVPDHIQRGGGYRTQACGGFQKRILPSLRQPDWRDNGTARRQRRVASQPGRACAVLEGSAPTAAGELFGKPLLRPWLLQRVIPASGLARRRW
jgi:hypothetical protein